MEELADLPSQDLHRFIKAGIDEEDDVMRSAPSALRDFFDNLEDPPWFDYESFRPGMRAFHSNTTNILVAFVTGVLIEGFATMIAKSFATTGRVLNRSTARRRLMQNNRHLLELFFPGGLRRDGDGWKLSMRLRFVHAKVRHLLANSDEWNTEAWGIPLSAAHLGFAITVFSMRLMQHSVAVGATLKQEEKDSIIRTWRYAGHVMGVPESILFTDEAHAREIFKIALMCEPEPDHDSATMANALVEAIPLTAGIEDPDEQRDVKALAYRLSRSLIGNRLADQLRFPKTNTFGVLLLYRLKQRLQQLLKSKQSIRSENFTQMLEISVYDEVGLGGMSYRMPDHVRSSKSSPY
ncbi:MAG: oxygenase MpaB family protein [Gemmatimonadetes bacterium]|nr:oxygenase MpaB family protein [Gemmatimonadota bacterium]MDE3258118.1 oxygenase MpaB family protein [Gemmatimonadota bacterium]